jgi:hypothetical protein
MESSEGSGKKPSAHHQQRTRALTSETVTVHVLGQQNPSIDVHWDDNDTQSSTISE